MGLRSALTAPHLRRMNGMADLESTTQGALSCSDEGCGRERHARGFCKWHYDRKRRSGTLRNSPLAPPKSTEERFWAKVQKSENGCWSWTAGKCGMGYGWLRLPGKDGGIVSAHRFSYNLHRGPILDGLELDHLCRNPSCVNPGHLEAVTHRENVRRGTSPPAVTRRTGVCQRGHSDWRISSGGNWLCRPCLQEAWRRSARKKRERAKEAL